MDMEQVASLSRVASEWGYPSPDDGLLGVATRFHRSLRNALQHITFVAVPEPTEAFIDGAMREHFGRLWDGHGLSLEPCHLGFEPTEPQVIKALASYLRDDAAGEVGLERTKSFLASILKNASPDARFTHSFEQAKSFTVQVEVPVRDGGTQRRIDLLCNWSSASKEEFAVAIEAKLGHSVMPGTLPTYRSYVHRLVSAPGNARLVLLTLSGAPDRPNKDWQPVAWRTLLSRWEKRLAADQDADPHFARFRRLIWNRC